MGPFSAQIVRALRRLGVLGAWTPVIGGVDGTSGQTYAAQDGTYLKIGQLVVAQFYAALTAKGTITGFARIEGLPYPVLATSSGINQAFAMMNFTNLAVAKILVYARVVQNTTTAILFGQAAAAANDQTTLVTADLSDTTTFRGIFIYFTAP